MSDLFLSESPKRSPSSPLQLEDGSRVAVIGGGPAGSFFSYFLLELAERLDLKLNVDLYEPRDFALAGPPGCNMCGGVISETLVQNLAIEGVYLHPQVVERGLDSYRLHTNTGSVNITAPDFERRIAAVFRGSGPRDHLDETVYSFDRYSFLAAQEKGATAIRKRVDTVAFVDGRPQISLRGGETHSYDLLVVSAGINTPILKSLQEALPQFQPPSAVKTYICEYAFGADIIEQYLGNSFHAFLLDIPHLEFAAIIPKGHYATVCLLGTKIDSELIQTFLNAPEVKAMMPPGWDPQQVSCQCSPKINVRLEGQPYADRLLVIGDSGVSRLYKDGMGAAYRMAKVAASTAILQGISEQDFRQHFWPACQRMAHDNSYGRMVFFVTSLIQKLHFAQGAVVRMVAAEQRSPNGSRTMSTVLWDMFTGSAPYTDIFLRTLNPLFLLRFLGHLTASAFTPHKS